MSCQAPSVSKPPPDMATVEESRKNIGLKKWAVEQQDTSVEKNPQSLGTAASLAA